MNWERIVELISVVIESVRKDYVIDNAIVRDDIFTILEKHCTVLYYPIEDERNCGFHIKKIVNDTLEDFIYINTAKPLEEQIFAAAHELGHIWNVAGEVWQMAAEDEALTTEMEEDITNRFAAELLMPTRVFRATFYEHKDELGVVGDQVKVDDLLRIIALQMSDFLVPYEAVRKRLHECNIINDEGRDFLKQNKDKVLERVEIYAKEQMSRLGVKEDKNKTIPGIRMLVEKAEAENSMPSFVLQRIKDDFEIRDIQVEDEILNIQVEDNVDGEDGSIG